MKAKTQIWGFLLFPLSMILLISTAWNDAGCKQ